MNTKNNIETGEYTLHSRGTNWFHFRIDQASAMESFSVTYCHDGSVCMTGDMGCLVWQRQPFPARPDYGFPYSGTDISYFAEKVVRGGEAQIVRAWYSGAAIIDIQAAIKDEDRDPQDLALLIWVLDAVSGYESGVYGQMQMLDEFNRLPHTIETDEYCDFGVRFTDMFLTRFEMLRSVSDQILAAVGE